MTDEEKRQAVMDEARKTLRSSKGHSRIKQLKLPKTSAGVKRLRVDAQEMILARSISPDARV
jgi:hypothetical protein